MRILVVGSGGREHALVWKIAQSPLVKELFCAPGNPGVAELAKLIPLKVDDVSGIVKWVRQNAIDLVVVGPEGPLVAGLADPLIESKIPVFGPSGAAAMLEGSKAFAKEVMASAGVPSASFATFTELEPALSHVRSGGGRVVVKADGLAAGKGVVVCDTLGEAEAALRAMLVDKIHGKSGARVVIEERLEGPEASCIALSDGERVRMLAPAQDHKRALDGDRGPNTGGMGAFSPTPKVDDAIAEKVERQIVLPIIREMARRGTPFRGALYAGLMLTKDGPKVIEFNVRLGDPETQPVLMRLKSDLVPALMACALGDLSSVELSFDTRAALGVVLAAEGYPGSVATGDPIEGTDGPFPPDVQVFHSGTAKGPDGELITGGGRVLTVCALGANLEEASRKAYQAAAGIRWRGQQFRRDIGCHGP